MKTLIGSECHFHESGKHPKAAEICDHFATKDFACERESVSY
jgi:hypothetical protein